MYQTLEILPGVTLRCRKATRFKQGALSIQFLRPMASGEAALNALLPAVLLRGCEGYPDLKCITEHLDDLYGASIGTLVRHIGDCQTTGLYCGFIEDRFALPGDAILAPMAEFISKLLFSPILEDGGFCREFVEGEKKNLISTIESQRSDKRAYAAGELLRRMCKHDPFGVPRLGTVEAVAAIDARTAYAHYQKLIAQSPVDIFYVGSAEPEAVAELLRPMFAGLSGARTALAPQTPFRGGESIHDTETMDIAQAKLAMGFVTPITNRDPRFAAMQLCNMIFGGGMTSKLFMQVRESLSLCYAVGSAYYATKGIVTVNAGIDACNEERTRRAVLAQLEACQRGEITPQELEGAREALLSSLRSVYDSPGAMENYFSTAALSGLGRSPEQYARELCQCTLDQVAEAARTVQYHSSFFLKGAAHE